jgi:hypothetical protein
MSKATARTGALLFALVGCIGGARATDLESLPKTQSASPNWAIQLPGVSYHFEQPTAKGQHWNQVHPGIGVERNESLSVPDWHVTYSAGVMKDSISKWGANAGVVWQKTLYEKAGSRLDAGPGVFFFYRTVNFGEPRKLFAAPLPVATFRNGPTSMGFNLVVVPPLKLSGGAGRIPGLVYFQLVRAL